MKLTEAHYRFFAYHRLNSSLFAGMKETAARPSVHDLIPYEENKNHDLHSTLETLRVARDRGQLIPALQRMAVYGDLAGGEKRETWCRRWLRKIDLSGKRDLY